MLHRSSVTVAATLAFAAAASAQVGSLYTFSQAVGAYTPISGGTVISTATSANTLDDVTFPVTLPFTFTYDGLPQTQVQVQTNGHIAFGAVSPGTTYTPMSSAVATPGFIAACGRDLQGGYVFASTSLTATNTLTNVSANGPLQIGDVIVRTGVPAGTTITAIAGNTITMSANATASSTGLTTTAYGPWSEMRWELVGSSPNQEVVFQWSNFRRFGTGLTVNNGTFLNFQIRLHENGEIRCTYGNCSPGVAGVTTTALHQVGLRGPTNAFPANINNRQNTKGTNDWDTSAAGTTNAVGELFNSVAPANVISNGLTYTWAPLVGVVATNTTLGAGCGASAASYYQLFATAAAMNLGGTALGMVGSPYNVIPGFGTLNPVGGSPTTLVLTDDSEATYTFVNGFTAPGWGAGVTVCSNGFISKATGNGTGFTPTAATFLAGTQDWFALGWHDLNPAIAGSGQVKVEETATLLTITYDGVWDFAGASAANANTMQMQVTNTGDVTYAYGTMSTLGNGFLVGYSPGGANIDPGSRTLLAASPFSLQAVDVPALALAALNTPQQLAGPNSWNLNATNLPSGFGLDIIGLGDAGILDLSFLGLGLPGCQLRATLDIINGPFIAGGAHPWSFTIPGGAPALNGVELFVQNAVLDITVNLALTTTTNGIKGKIGNL